MKKQLIYFLQRLFPLLIVLLLWRLSVPFWNPAGILAIIPIFYCSFISPEPWFTPYAILFCFLIDYKSDTLLFWTSMYCLFYVINGFQNFVDLRRLDRNALPIFMIFFGISVLILICINFNLDIMVRSVWLFAWTSVLYLPITILIKKVCRDR